MHVANQSEQHECQSGFTTLLSAILTSISFDTISPSPLWLFLNMAPLLWKFNSMNSIYLLLTIMVDFWSTMGVSFRPRSLWQFCRSFVSKMSHRPRSTLAVFFGRQNTWKHRGTFRRWSLSDRPPASTHPLIVMSQEDRWTFFSHTSVWILQQPTSIIFCSNVSSNNQS